MSDDQRPCGDDGGLRRATGWRVLCGVLLLAGVARTAAHASTPLWVSADSVRLHRVATLLHDDRGAGVDAMTDWTAPLPVVVWSPLLRTGESLRPAIALHHLLGTISAGLVCWTLLRLSTPVVALLGGLALAASPQVLFMERWLLGETIHLLLVSLTCAAAARVTGRPGPWTPAALGGALGLAWLTKSSSLALGALPVAAVIALAPWPLRSADARRLAPRAALALGAFAAVALPWHVHVWREFRSFNVVPNSQRNFLLYAGEFGLFDSAGGHEGNATLMREVGATLDPGQPIRLQGWRIVNHVTDVHGRGAGSERVAGAILAEEVRRKPTEYAWRVLRTLGFLAGLSSRGVREPHDQLTYAWSGNPPQATIATRDAPEAGSPGAQALLLRLHALEAPVLRAAFLLGLLGAVGACCRGAGRWRWGLLFGLPLLALLGGLSLTLAANSRFVYPFLPLAILAAASPFTRPWPDAPDATGAPAAEGPSAAA